MTHRLDQMNVLDAVYKVAKGYPGGVEALSLRLGLGAGTLRKKLGRHVETHHLTVEELSEIVEMSTQVRNTDALLPIRALCWRHGGVFVPMPDTGNATGSEFLRLVIRQAKEQGDIIRKIEEALANDKQIDARELRDLEQEFEEALAASSQLLEALRDMAVK